MRDIDWAKRTYDLYVDCARIGDDIPLTPDTGNTISRLSMYVLDADTSGNFDEIVIK